MNENLRYVLEHEKENKQCTFCYAIWFIFDDNGNTGVYRLGSLPPENCHICAPIDREIEQGTILTSERWITLDS